MSETKNVLDVEYKIFDARTDALLIIRESPECPGITELVMQEKEDRASHKYGTHITVDDDDLPLLIEALQRRCQDVQRNPKEP